MRCCVLYLVDEFFCKSGFRGNAHKVCGFIIKKDADVNFAFDIPNPRLREVYEL